MFSLLLFFACGDEEKSDTSVEEVSETAEEVVEVETEESEEDTPVEEEGEFVGYFSPSDYQQATSLVDSLKGLSL